MKPRARKKERLGTVISDKMTKSIVVRIDKTATHPVYKRIVRTSARIMVHDEKGEAKTGDKVKIQQTRALSKNKRWRLAEVLKS